jgi:hypothetical protein
MQNRQRIRDLRFENERWIASLVAEDEGGAWSGGLVFFRDEPGEQTRAEDSLRFESLSFDEMVAQASALSVEQMSRRLARSLNGGVS